jgi:hypothetical protein
VKALAITLTAAATATLLLVFASWIVSIWQPWGHQEEWQSTTAVLFFLPLAFGLTAAYAWIEAPAKAKP